MKWLGRSWQDDEYPMYHCQVCGRFFKDSDGTQQEGIRGQQTSITAITCVTCRQPPAGAGAGLTRF